MTFPVMVTLLYTINGQLTSVFRSLFFLSVYSFSQLKQALLRELSEETGLNFSEESLEISTLGLWEVLYIHFIFILVA